MNTTTHTELSEAERSQQLAAFEKMLSLGYRITNDPSAHTGVRVKNRVSGLGVRLYMDDASMPMVGITQPGSESVYDLTVRHFTGITDATFDVTSFGEPVRVSALEGGRFMGCTSTDDYVVEYEAGSDGYFKHNVRPYRG